MQVVVGQVETSHADKVVDIRRYLGEGVVCRIDRVYAVLFLRLGRRKFLHAIVGKVQLYGRLVEVLLDAAYVVLRHVNLENTHWGCAYRLIL